MKQKPIFLYIIAMLSLLIPAPGRLAYGILLILEIYFVVIFTVLVQSVVKYLKLRELSIPLILISMFTFVIIYQQLLNLFSGLYTFVLSLNFYLTAMTALPLTFFSNENFLQKPLGKRMVFVLKNTSIFAIFAIIFSSARDLLSFGTLSLPCRTGLREFRLIKSFFENRSFFWNSIPFALVLLAFCLALITYIDRKFDIVRRSLA